MNLRLRLRQWVCLWGLWLLAGCAPLAPKGSPVAPPVGATACSVASLNNPLRAAPGLGGTGSSALRGPDPGGIGGTGRVATGSGLGGTGSPAQSASPGGGIGGTGIVGVVTGFASICVNGAKVEYNPDTLVQRDGRIEPLSELAVGQLVVLQAVGQTDRLQAQRIVVLDAAVGPLTALDVAQGSFAVMGQPAVALERADLNGLRLGQWVRVSGLRLASGEIRSTRVERTAAGRAVAIGPFSWGGTQGPRVGATPVNLAGVVLPVGLSERQEVQVHGEWTGVSLRVRGLEVQPTRAAVGNNQKVLLQGYVHGVNGREVQLGYDTVILDDALRVEGGELSTLSVDQQVQVQGRMDAQQRVTVERLAFWREGRRGESGLRVAPSATSKSSGDSDDSNERADDSSSGKRSESGSDDSGRGRGRGRGRGGDSGSSGSSGSGGTTSGSGSSSGSSGDSGGDSGRGRGRGRGRGGRD